MRALVRNKQKMFYSVPTGTREQYVYDDEGNITYIDVDGEQVPVTTGEKENTYSVPVEFRANITSKLKEAIIRAFGIDNSENYAQLVVTKNAFTMFNVGTVIWKNSSIKYHDAEETDVDGGSADYVIRGVLDEEINEDMYLLKKLSGGDD